MFLCSTAVSFEKISRLNRKGAELWPRDILFLEIQLKQEFIEAIVLSISPKQTV